MLCAECTGDLEEGAQRCPHCGQDPRLLGRYWLLQRIGSGALGQTYRARAVAGGEEVAIKELPLRSLHDVKAQELFQREARVLRQLDHPGVPRYIEDFQAGSGRSTAYYLVQELVEGQTLAEALRDHRPSTLQVLEILDELLVILTYLHSLTPPVVHRDIKPSNVMRKAGKEGEKPSLVLIDFGAVRDVIKDPSAGGSTIAGTFGYMAPEQFRGVATPASDLYAAGVLAVHLLTGLPPERLLDPLNRLDWQGQLPGTHPAVLALLRTLIEPDPERRAQDASAVRRQLARTIGLLDPRQSVVGGEQGLTADPEANQRLQQNLAKLVVQARREQRVRRSFLVFVFLFLGFGAWMVAPAFRHIAKNLAWVEHLNRANKLPPLERAQLRLNTELGRATDCVQKAGVSDLRGARLEGELGPDLRIRTATLTTRAPWPRATKDAVFTCLRKELGKQLSVERELTGRRFVLELEQGAEGIRLAAPLLLSEAAAPQIREAAAPQVRGSTAASLVDINRDSP